MKRMGLKRLSFARKPSSRSWPSRVRASARNGRKSDIRIPVMRRASRKPNRTVRNDRQTVHTTPCRNSFQ